MKISEPLQVLVDPLGWESPRHTSWNHNRGITHLVLASGNTIWEHCPRTVLDAIVVYRRKDNPHADWARDLKGRIRVGLNAQCTYWAKFAFQFAHEFCHVLAAQSHDPDLRWQNVEHCNFWLEESLCEVASYFALRALGRSWKSPIEWPFEAEFFNVYSSNRMEEAPRQLPQGQSFQQWFNEEESFLQENPVHGDREKNCIVASQLLPLFEKYPAGWETIPFLNVGERIVNKPLKAHLTEWRDNSPPDLHDFISRIAGVFCVDL
jgi:hypothetical protein